jgi:hypothetical protein
MSRLEEKTAVLMAERLKELAAHFAKPTTPAAFNKKQYANTTVTLYLAFAGRGQHGDCRYTKPIYDARNGRERNDGKGVFVIPQNMKPRYGAEYGKSGWFELPLWAAINHGFVRVPA